MYNFIEDYLKDPSAAILNARKYINSCNCTQTPDEEQQVYTIIDAPEFRLYSEIIF